MLDKLCEDRLQSKGELVDVITFAESDWGLGIKLFPVQKFILKLMYGMKLERDLKTITVFKDYFGETPDRVYTEWEYLQYLKDKGRISPSYQEGESRRETVLAIGRRGSKTRLSSICCVYGMYKLMALYNPQKHYGVPEGDKIGFVAIATAQKQSKELFGPVRMCVLSSPYFERELISGSSEDSIKLQTRHTRQLLGDDGPPSIIAEASACTARGGRGSANIIVVLDEFAHFILEGGNRSDEEVYRAVTPTVATFGKDGKIISISSPLSKSGKFYSLFLQGMTDNPDILSFQAPCWEVNHKIPPEVLKSDYRKDPEGYLNEYGARWSGHSVDYLRDPNIYLDVVMKDRQAADSGERRQVYYLGLDIGKENDPTAIAVGHVNPEHKIIIDLIEEYGPEDLDTLGEDRDDLMDSTGQVLSLKAIAARVEYICTKFNVQKGVYDQFNGWGLSEYLAMLGLGNQFEMVHYTRQLNSLMYKNFRRMLHEKRIESYPNPEFEKQLFALQCLNASKHEIVVEAPHGGHDDMGDAVVRMVWLCSESRLHKAEPTMAVKIGGGDWTSGTLGSVENGGTGAVSYRHYQYKRRKMTGGNPRQESLRMWRKGRR